MILDDLVQNIKLTSTIGLTDVEVKDIQFDSRKVTTGSLFVATCGSAVDGHDFIPKSIEQGATSACISEF